MAQLIYGALLGAIVFPFLSRRQRMRQVGRWSAGMLRRLGVSLESHGVPRAGATLVVANHVSWLDILVLNAVQPARFVSKADVRRWPVLGWLVACGGTLFIERARPRDAMRVVHQMAKAFKAGHTVAVFPEGTTTDGHRLLPFHANLLQAAISTETPVQPVALRYCDATDRVSLSAAYVGDMHLLASLWGIVTTRGLRAQMIWLTSEATAHADRRALAEHLRCRISEALDGTGVHGAK